MARAIAVYLESGTKRTFASAVEWPGWARSGKTEEEALERLAAYAGRYRAVAERADVPFPRDVRLTVVERLVGGGGTDFGVIGEIPSPDGTPVTARQLVRLRRLLEAAWETFDATAARFHGRELAKGPRGGGRDRDRIVSHVLEADEAYLAQLGSRRPRSDAGDDASRVELVRAAALAALEARARNRPLDDPARTRTPWPPRYYARRSAWHALDHAWEIEDRAL